MSQDSLIKAGLVSVMMPAYNAAAYIESAIDSLLNQTYAHWELIVIDDGSIDSTPALVKRYTDPRIRMYQKQNGGEASARNAALEHLSGEYVAFLDTDDLFSPHHLQATVEHLQSNRSMGGVYTDGHYIDEQGHVLERLSDRRRGPYQGFIFEQVVRSSDVFGPPVCMVLRRKPILDHQFSYDESIGLGMDWDFITRFSGKNHFGYVDQITCSYRIHQSNLTRLTDTDQRLIGRLKCRKKAMKLDGFSDCALEIRFYVFYDMLVNILPRNPVQQTTIIEQSEFQELPDAERSRLLRLMAGEAVVLEVEGSDVQSWLAESARLNPSDRRSQVLLNLYQVSPALCRWFLRLRRLGIPKTRAHSPFRLPEKALGVDQA